jgi:dihydrofolate reductase
MPPLIAIAAMAANRVIGAGGKLPWHYPEDLQFFKRTTLGHPILMGRSTYESIGRPLPGRQNIVLSRTLAPRDGITVIRSIDQYASLPLEEGAAIFVIGGAQVYQQLLPYCTELYLTYIPQDVPGDAFFPEFEHLFPNKAVLNTVGELEFRRYSR